MMWPASVHRSTPEGGKQYTTILYSFEMLIKCEQFRQLPANLLIQFSLVKINKFELCKCAQVWNI